MKQEQCAKIFNNLRYSLGDVGLVTDEGLYYDCAFREIIILT